MNFQITSKCLQCLTMFTFFVGKGVAGKMKPINFIWIRLINSNYNNILTLIISILKINSLFLLFIAARPNYKPQPVITTVSLDNSNGLAGQLLAKCTFPDNKLNPGTLLYQVTWFFDNTFGLTTETVLYNDIHKTDIILDQTNIKTLGRKVNVVISISLFFVVFIEDDS